MAIYSLRREQFIPRAVDEVFSFFSDAGNLQKITPPWLNFQILTPRPIDIRPGMLLDYRLKWHGFPIPWRTKIVSWNPSKAFTDLQIRGPYKLWQHTHTFNAAEGGTRMVDVVNYELPLGVLGSIAHSLAVRRDLERVFDYRLEVIAALFPASSATSNTV